MKPDTTLSRKKLLRMASLFILGSGVSEFPGGLSRTATLARGWRGVGCALCSCKEKRSQDSALFARLTLPTVTPASAPNLDGNK